MLGFMERSSTDQAELLEPDESASWAALLMLHRMVLQDLDAELRREHGLAVTEFDVLITLASAPGKQLGMSALAHRAMLSPAGTTHLVTRLERDGLVKRSIDKADRRKWFTVLTDKGDQALQAAQLTHGRVLRRRFSEHGTAPVAAATGAVLSVPSRRCYSSSPCRSVRRPGCSSRASQYRRTSARSH